MNIVMVKHDNVDRTYCFEVPDQLVPYVASGKRLICATRRGETTGVAITGVISGDGALDIAKQGGARLPLSKIVGVVGKVPMDEIKIPKYMTENIPSTEKIASRINEYRRSHCFNTPVFVKDGYLYDGYTAFLVARMLDLKCIPYRLRITA